MSSFRTITTNLPFGLFSSATLSGPLPPAEATPPPELPPLPPLPSVDETPDEDEEESEESEKPFWEE